MSVGERERGQKGKPRAVPRKVMTAASRRFAARKNRWCQRRGRGRV